MPANEPAFSLVGGGLRARRRLAPAPRENIGSFLGCQNGVYERAGALAIYGAEAGGV